MHALPVCVTWTPSSHVSKNERERQQDELKFYQSKEIRNNNNNKIKRKYNKNIKLMAEHQVQCVQQYV